MFNNRLSRSPPRRSSFTEQQDDTRRPLPLGWNRAFSNNVNPGRVYYTNGRQSQWKFPKQEQDQFFVIAKAKRQARIQSKYSPSFSSPFLENQHISPEVREANRRRNDEMEAWARQQALQAQQRETPYQRNERIAREQREAQRQIELAEIRRIDALRQAQLRANHNQQNSSASQFDQQEARWQQERQRRIDSDRP